MKVMNVAVVGAGIYGINHVNAYTWNPNTNLVAVCDLNKEITDRIAEPVSYIHLRAHET